MASAATRVCAALATAAVFGVGVPATAHAGSAPASAFKRCYPGAPVDCAIVRVPLDRTGRVPGTVALHAIRLRADHPAPPGQPRSAVVGLAGGPGQAALPLLEDFYLTIAPALRTRDLIVFDQRGTGLSGVLRCPSFDRKRTGDPLKAIPACAAHIGPARAFYTTRDSADDMEAIRRAAGVDKLVPYGTSYGTKVALAYAQRYPAQTERLVLDSLVDLNGPDPFYRDTFAAIPRVLRDLCAAPACDGITPDPVADLGRLVKRLQTRPLTGRVVGGDGKPRPRRIGRASLLDILLEGDFDPPLRAEFPAAVRAALAGDGAPMLRLARIAMVHEYFPPDPPAVFSSALYAATSCEDGPLPWGPAQSLQDRWNAARAEAASIPDAALAPFDRATAAATDTLRLCAPWPGGAPPSAPDPQPLPDVPTLLLGGAADLRTPIENDAPLAARLPHASVLIVPEVGHSVIDSDLSGCADAAVRRFFADQPVTGCSKQSEQVQQVLSDVVFPPTPVPPRSLAALATPRRVHGRAGRTVRAVELTFFDSLLTLLSATLEQDQSGAVVRFGGLRGGRLIARTRPRVSLRLDRYAYVPGATISGELGHLAKRGRVRLRVGGSKAAQGTVTLDLKHDRITGRLGARRLRLSLTRDIGEAVNGLYQVRAAMRARGRVLGRCCSASQVLGQR
jgi:pimeloyl-ACP methyl ester carboxylesterase